MLTQESIFRKKREQASFSIQSETVKHMLRTETPDTPNYSLWKTSPLTAEAARRLAPRALLEHLVIASHLAPSTHNTQPWRYRISEEEMTIQVFLDRSSILPASDKHGQQTLVSMGACLKNLEVAARYLGCMGIVELAGIAPESLKPRFETDEQHLKVATYSIQSCPDDPNYEARYRALFSRRSMRVEFDQAAKLSTSVQAEISRIAEANGFEACIIKDPVRRQAIAEFQGQADGYVINSRPFATELGDWLLPNDTTSCVGMPGMGFGLKDDEAIRMHKGLLGEAPLEPEDGLKFATAGKMSIEKSPLICCLTGKQNEPKEWIVSGMAFEEIFLSLHAAGYCIAVHAGIVEVPLINRIFAATLGTTRRPMCLFRVGVPKRDKDSSRPHSPRLGMKQILI